MLFKVYLSRTVPTPKKPCLHGREETVGFLPLAGTCPASLVLKHVDKGHNIKGNYLTGKPPLLGRGASIRTK